MHSPAPNDDHLLLQAFAQGNDHAAFARLVERHARWIFAAAFRQLHDRHLAQDAVQIVFILLARRARAMNDRQFRKISGWLFNTLQFTVKDMRRAAARRLNREELAMRAAAEKAADPPPSEASIRELAEVLDAAVSRLPEAYRTAILLRFYQDLPFDQIGQAMAITEAAARKRVERALGLLRKQIGSPAGNALLSASAVYGGEQANPSLASAAVQAALAAKSTVLPAGITSTLKGVTTLMAISKLQTAAVAASIALLIVLPASLVTIHFATQPIANTVPAITMPEAAASAPNPHDFRQVYALKPGQVLRRVVALDDTRAAMYDAAHEVPISPDPQRPAFDVYPELNGPMIIQWENDQPKLAGLFPNAQAISLMLFLQVRLDEFPQDIEGNAKDITIPGDFAFKAGGTPEDYRRALVSILQDDLKKPVAITYRDVPRKVIVLRGKWNFHSARPNTPDLNGPTIELYGTQLTPPNYAPMGFAKTAHNLGGFIGSWINQSVIVEAHGLPSQLFWHGNSVEDLPNAPSKAHDPTLMLNHIAEQTGLTWSEETRTVHRLFVEETK